MYHPHAKKRAIDIAACLMAAAFVMGGVFLRVSNLGDQSLWIDEGFTINGAQAVLDHGYPLLDSGGVYPYGPLTVYLTAGALKAFGFDAFEPWAARVPAVLLGSFLALIVALFAKRLFPDRSIVWVTALFLASFCSWAIAWSRQARGYIAIAFFGLLTFYLILRYRETKEKKSLIFAALSYIAALLSHGPAILLLPAFISLVAVKPTNARLSLRASLLAVAVPIASLLGGVALSFHADYVRFMSGNWGFTLFLWGGLAGCALAAFDKERRERLMYVALPCGSGLVTAIFFGLRQEGRYLFVLIPFAILLTVYAAVRLTELLRVPKKFAALATCAVLVAYSWPALDFVPKRFHALEPGVPQADFARAYDYIKKNMQEGDVVVSMYAHLHEIYLNQKGYWLPTSLSPYPEELAGRLAAGKDFYVGAPIATGTDSLLNIARRSHGFALFTGFGVPKQADLYFSLTGLDGTEKVANTGRPEYRNRVWIVRF